MLKGSKVGFKVMMSDVKVKKKKSCMQAVNCLCASLCAMNSLFQTSLFVFHPLHVSINNYLLNAKV